MQPRPDHAKMMIMYTCHYHATRPRSCKNSDFRGCRCSVAEPVGRIQSLHDLLHVLAPGQSAGQRSLLPHLHFVHGFRSPRTPHLLVSERGSADPIHDEVQLFGRDRLLVAVVVLERLEGVLLQEFFTVGAQRAVPQGLGPGRRGGTGQLPERFLPVLLRSGLGTQRSRR